MDMIMKNHPHPGEVLREMVLEPLGISVTEAARRLGVSRVALSRVVNGRAAISTDLAIRLEAAGAGTARSWLTMQTHYELSRARERGQPAPRGAAGGLAPRPAVIRLPLGIRRPGRQAA